MKIGSLESRHADAGFSLLETLVVLVILGMTMAMVSATLRPSRTQSLKTVSAQVQALLSTARLKAISRAETIAVEIDVSKKTLKLTGEDLALELPKTFEITATVGKETVRRERSGAIVFSADSTSTGGEIILKDGLGQSTTIVTSWLTGLSNEVRNGT